ncbi:MAG: alkaline phytoceramidase, partial [Gammaproteobacteria bacterium]
WPLLIAGITSVIYWHFTELQGLGDLRFYAFIQFFPMLAIPVTLLCFHSRFNLTGGYWILITCYFLAKLFEHFDKDIYSFLVFTISGHSIKHMIAALGLYILLRGYEQRKQIELEKR